MTAIPVHGRVLIISYMDGFANSSKPTHIVEFLGHYDCDVTLLNTLSISRRGESGYRRWLPASKPWGLLLYVLEMADALLQGLPKFRSKRLYYHLLVLRMQVRGRLLAPYVRTFEHVICESQIDSLVFLGDLGATNTIYDCATPWADELYYGGEISERHYQKFKSLETRVYEDVRHLSFHWECYADYVKKYYKDTGNIFIFDGGTHKKEKRARYSSTPKIVYLGFLGGYWINLPLLERLSRLCQIDVYGSPPPPVELGLNYKGYADSSVVADYQFGLITISEDRLRSEGFSAKHVEYLSFGLPVLVPDWRTTTGGMGGTIHYNEQTFVDLVERYSGEAEWERASLEAVQQADEYEWTTVLKPLLDVMGIPSRASEPGL
jgi:hypothetical protein